MNGAWVYEAEDGTYWIIKDGRRIAHVDTFDPYSKEAKEWADKIARGLNREEV